MNIRYVLFDLDGTLSDPAQGISSCINYALNSVGLQENDWEKLKSYIGPPLNDTFRLYGFNEEECNRLTDTYRVLYHSEGVHQTVMYEGVPEMLERIKANGAVISLASCKPADQSRIILEEHGILKYFDFLAGATYDNRIYSKEQVIASALSMIGESGSGEGAMVGDRNMDIDGAHAHGLVAVGSAYGYGNSEELSRADYIARSPMEIADILFPAT